ncbi:hypothetical protein M2140_000223 [Clostridiales Family XIII bacterium PM5-7]
MNVNDLIYGCFVLGLVLWQYPSIDYVLMTIKNRIIITRDLNAVTRMERKQPYGIMGKHIQKVLDASGMNQFIPSAEIFFIVTIMIFIGITWMLSIIEPLTTSIVFGLFVGSLPYFYTITRLNRQRIARSREGDILVHELLNNYKIYDYNIGEAIDMTIATIEEAPHGRQVLMNLSRGLHSAMTKPEVEIVLDDFRYALDTTWGNILASSISFAHINGVRVDCALEDLAETMTKSRKVLEHGKRENNEARLMLTYLAPVSYLLSIVGACKYFGFTLQKFFVYQFSTPTGLSWFLIMVMIYIGGVLVNGFLASEKMDI